MKDYCLIGTVSRINSEKDNLRQMGISVANCDRYDIYDKFDDKHYKIGFLFENYTSLFGYEWAYYMINRCDKVVYITHEIFNRINMYLTYMCKPLYDKISIASSLPDSRDYKNVITSLNKGVNYFSPDALDALDHIQKNRSFYEIDLDSKTSTIIFGILLGYSYEEIAKEITQRFENTTDRTVRNTADRIAENLGLKNREDIKNNIISITLLFMARTITDSFMFNTLGQIEIAKQEDDDGPTVKMPEYIFLGVLNNDTMATPQTKINYYDKIIFNFMGIKVHYDKVTHRFENDKKYVTENIFLKDALNILDVRYARKGRMVIMYCNKDKATGDYYCISRPKYIN